MRLYSFAFVTICSIRRKILNMFEKLWRIKVLSIIQCVSMRFNAFINRMFVHSVRQLALEFAAVSKFAYRDKLICISRERGRSIDKSLQ